MKDNFFTDKKNMGVTLIELMITIAMAAIIFGGLSQLIAVSLENYQLNAELNDAMNKITPVMKRIENAVTESAESGGVLTQPTITSASENSITVKQSNGITYTYFWDKDNSGEIRRGTDALFRVNSVKVRDFSFEFYKVQNFVTSLITDYSEVPSDADYMRINVSLIGSGQDADKSPELVFSTGIKLP